MESPDFVRLLAAPALVRQECLKKLVVPAPFLSQIAADHEQAPLLEALQE